MDARWEAFRYFKIQPRVERAEALMESDASSSQRIVALSYLVEAIGAQDER
jgi:hypothetical protein